MESTQRTVRKRNRAFRRLVRSVYGVYRNDEDTAHFLLAAAGAFAHRYARTSGLIYLGVEARSIACDQFPMHCTKIIVQGRGTR